MEVVCGVRKETAVHVIGMRTVDLHVAKCSRILCKSLDYVGIFTI